MKAVKVLFLFIGILCVGQSDDNVANIPNFGQVIGAVEDVVQGAVNSAADVVVDDELLLTNTKDLLSGYIKKALDKFKELMVDKIDLLGLPRLEPLSVEHINIDIKHEIGIFKGTLDNVLISKLSNFITRDVSVQGLFTSNITMNLFFEDLVINGDYDIDANVGDLFHVFGKGPYEIILHDLDTIVTIENLQINLVASKAMFENIRLSVTLGSLTSNLTNLMGGGEPEKLFNKVIEEIAPEAVQVLWPEIAAIIEPKIKEMVNKKLDEVTLKEIMKLFGLP